MFWGLILKANKKYSQTVQKDFHLSAAALDLTKCGDTDVQVMLTSEEHTYLLCTLGKKTPQFNLDLNFKQGEQVSLSTKGEGIVHLTGYLIPDDEELFGDLGDEDSELEEELELASPVAAKGKGGKQDRIAKKVAQKVNAKEVLQPAEDEDDDMDESFKLPKDAKKQLENGDSEDDSDEDDSEAEGGDATLDGEEDDDDSEDDEDDDDDDDDDEDDSDDDDDSEEEEVEQPKAKVAKLEKKPSKQNGLENGKASSKELKKDDKSPGQQQQNKEEASKTRTLQGGLVVEDIKVGSGTEAKPGKKIAVYYEGRLKKNNKIFDATLKGPGFKFALGRGEVIKGWDLGVTGMKVGGKRRLTVPHQLAYGTRGSPPTIPGNSTLVFDVELKNVF